MNDPRKRKIVIINQASNYLTIDICNAFSKKFKQVSLVTGSVHVQGDDLLEAIDVKKINKWVQHPASKKFLSYILACVKIYWLLLFRYRNHEVLFISIPPMAYLMMVVLPNRFSILIWDVYPDVLKITGMKESNPLYRFWGYLNRKIYKKAYRIFTIGNRMRELLEKYLNDRKVAIIPLWSVFETSKQIEKSDNPFVKEHNLDGKFIVQYSGNIGLTHYVEVMVELAEMLKDQEHILFQIIGRGPRMPLLKNLVQEKNLPNCHFLPYQTDEMFPYSLSAADLGVVILDDVISKGSVPSKSYNLMSYGIPSLYIASEDSELNAYAEKYNHAECFSHDELSEVAKFVLRLSKEKKLYKNYVLNSMKASKDFQKKNAEKLVDYYLSDKN